MSIKENLKESVDGIKGYTAVVDGTEKLQPVWNVIKNKGGYKLILMSLVLTAIFIPAQFVIGLITNLILGEDLFASSILSQGFSFYAVERFFDYIKWEGTGFVVKVIICLIISAVVGIISFIVSTLLVTNATCRSASILSEEDRIVGVGEYFKLALVDIVPFSVKYILNITLPIFVVGVVGGMIEVVPFIRGNNIATFIIAIGTYGLKFRFFAMMLGIDKEKSIKETTPYWLVFAVMAYLVRIVFNFELLMVAIDLGFILYSVLVLTDSKLYFGGEKLELDMTKAIEG